MTTQPKVTGDEGTSRPRQVSEAIAFGNEDIVMAVRDAARQVTGGNCAYADDDVAILEHLAVRAVKAGLVEGLHPTVARKAIKACADLEVNLTTGETWNKLIAKVMDQAKHPRDGSS